MHFFFLRSLFFGGGEGGGFGLVVEWGEKG